MAYSQTVLVVDDDPINVMVLTDFLEGSYYVRSSNNPEDVMRLANQTPIPNCILLDVVMPNKDGYDVCHELKNNPQTKDIPVIFITSRTEIEDEEKGFKIGAVDYIAKPFTPPLVLSRVKNHIALYEQKQELAKLNDDKNRFLGIAAHDLRNPLMAISGFSELLMNPLVGEVNEKQERYILAINESCRTMQNLIDDLLDVSIIESGKFDLNLENSDIDSLVRNIIFMHEQQALKKKIAVNITVADIVPTSFFLDKPKMEQLVGNLLSNAIKYSYPDSKIDINLNMEGDNLVLEVVDQGQGIPVSELDSMFTPFEKTSVRSTAGEKSIGLGLPIVKRIVKGHGGDIKVASEVGVGSCFKVIIPNGLP